MPHRNRKLEENTTKTAGTLPTPSSKLEENIIVGKRKYKDTNWFVANYWGDSKAEKKVLQGVTEKCDTLDKVTDILVKMTKALNSPEYCEGINKYNVRGIYEVWARKILEVCETR
jgi:hypothetical protein